MTPAPLGQLSHCTTALSENKLSLAPSLAQLNATLPCPTNTEKGGAQGSWTSYSPIRPPLPKSAADHPGILLPSTTSFQR